MGVTSGEGGGVTRSRSRAVRDVLAESLATLLEAAGVEVAVQTIRILRRRLRDRLSSQFPTGVAPAP